MSTEQTPLAAEEDSAELRSLLRGALQVPPNPPDVLEGVQRKLRERSGGKFYHDRWSTDRHPPVLTYLATSALMLLVVVVAFLILRPLSGEPLPEQAPHPVQVLPSLKGN
jgi:hypothetical protein